MGNDYLPFWECSFFVRCELLKKGGCNLGCIYCFFGCYLILLFAMVHKLTILGKMVGTFFLHMEETNWRGMTLWLWCMVFGLDLSTISYCFHHEAMYNYSEKSSILLITRCSPISGDTKSLKWWTWSLSGLFGWLLFPFILRCYPQLQVVQTWAIRYYREAWNMFVPNCSGMIQGCWFILNSWDVPGSKLQLFPYNRGWSSTQ